MDGGLYCVRSGRGRLVGGGGVVWRWGVGVEGCRSGEGTVGAPAYLSTSHLQQAQPQRTLDERPP